jgi:hypothetical protein
MKALYMWFSCLTMKTCRKTDIHGVAPMNRLEIHNFLVELSKANPSIRNGLSASKLFRLDQIRKHPKDWDFSWIPPDSPAGCNSKKNYSFPKRVGIVYIEIRKSGKERRQEEKFLNVLKKLLENLQ